MRTTRDTPVGPSLPFSELVERSRIVVECAGHEAVAQLGVAALRAGRDLLVVSLGALADDELLASLAQAGPGRLKLATGALGGVDLVRAAALTGRLDRVRLVITKPPGVLIQDWMSDGEANRLRSTRTPVVVFEGTARDAAMRFPRSANVAAALALAAGGWQGIEAVVVADPGADRTGHDIECCGDAGEYRFTIKNRPTASNPATSAVVPYAVLRAVSDEAAATPWRFQ